MLINQLRILARDCHVMYSHSSQIVWFSVFNLVNVDKPVANLCQRLSCHVFSFLTGLIGIGTSCKMSEKCDA